MGRSLRRFLGLFRLDLCGLTLVAWRTKLGLAKVMTLASPYAVDYVRVTRLRVLWQTVSCALQSPA